MRSVVIYQSTHGNTERIARAVAEGLSEHGEARAVPLAEVQPGDLEQAHLVVLGVPTHGKGSVAMRWFLERSPDGSWFGRPMAAFDTRLLDDRPAAGSAARLAALLEAMGSLLLAPPESFLSTGMDGPLEEGEVGRARVWGRHLHLAERVSVEGE